MTSEIAHCTPQLYWDVMCVCDYLLWSEPSIMSRLLHSRHFDEVPCVAMCSFFTFKISDFKKRLQLHLLLQLHIFDLLFPIFPSLIFLIIHCHLVFLYTCFLSVLLLHFPFFLQQLIFSSSSSSCDSSSHFAVVVCEWPFSFGLSASRFSSMYILPMCVRVCTKCLLIKQKTL